MKKLSLFLLISIVLFSLPVFAQDKFSFAVLGDNRDGDRIFQMLIERINEDPEIAFVVNTGDLVPSGRDWQYKKYLEMTKKLKVKMINVIGNHELFFGGYKRFLKYFGRSYYSWNYKKCHFIKLDNVSQEGLGRKQKLWLKRDLSKNKSKHVFVFLHKPFYDPSGSYPHYVMKPKEERARLTKLFSLNKVKYIFAGHIHGYGRKEKDGIVHVITGGAGAPLYLPRFSGGFHHYVKVTVDGDKIADEVVKLVSDEE